MYIPNLKEGWLDAQGMAEIQHSFVIVHPQQCHCTMIVSLHGEGCDRNEQEEGERKRERERERQRQRQRQRNRDTETEREKGEMCEI